MKLHIIFKKENKKALELSEKIKAYALSRGHTISNVPSRDTNIIVAIGGDGTLIHSVSKYAELGIPFVGINTGNLGFLAAGDAKRWKEILDKIFVQKTYVSERLVLDVISKKIKLTAVNEIAVKGRFRVVNLSVKVSNTELMKIAGDGLIVATQTGSTAYSLSAGGPIVSPLVDTLILTPINPIGLPIPSFVLSADESASITIESGEDIALVIDGQEHAKISAGEKVEIKGGKNKIKLIYMEKDFFIKALNSKFGLSRRLGS